MNDLRHSAHLRIGRKDNFNMTLDGRALLASAGFDFPASGCRIPRDYVPRISVHRSDIVCSPCPGETQDHSCSGPSSLQCGSSLVSFRRLPDELQHFLNAGKICRAGLARINHIFRRQFLKFLTECFCQFLPVETKSFLQILVIDHSVSRLFRQAKKESLARTGSP